MNARERLDNKFKEILESRDELVDRMHLQEETVLASEKIMKFLNMALLTGRKFKKSE